MKKSDFEMIVSSTPEQPGIYKFYNKNNIIIYVGKAKNLRKRVNSYFSNFENHSNKTKELLYHLEHIEFTITPSDHDAFLLENSLIKNHQPKYNINLKDDKTYPFIVVKDEPFPRIVLSRKKTKNNKEYIGPYTSIYKVKELLSLIRSQIPLRTCKLDLSHKKIQSSVYKKPCLEYHIGNCKAPCMGWQTKEEYEENIIQVKKILSGNIKPIVEEYKQKMLVSAKNLEFEKAQIYKKKIEELNTFKAKSFIVQHKNINADIFAVKSDNNSLWINYIIIKNGSVLQSDIFQFNNPLEEQTLLLLPTIILDLRNRLKSNNLEIIVPFYIEYEDANLCITIPKSGTKKQLLEWGFQNIEAHQKSLFILSNHTTQKIEVLKDLQALLHLPKLPVYIECFDNSHFQGAAQVSAMVCFMNGIPYKKYYRTFHIKSTSISNDFQSMEEAVYRRYKHLQDTQQALPNLLIIDGGKGQLSSAMKALKKLHLHHTIPTISLAKNIEEIFFPEDNNAILLPFDNPTLSLIREIRNEIHRFVIDFHRKSFLKKFKSSELDEVHGIGEKTKQLLLQKFKSITQIKQAEEKELITLIGKKRTQILKNYFNANHTNR
ncbi:MAG: excinuclease ABC subunit UvrC [Chitinophagaceae bacterium]